MMKVTLDTYGFTIIEDGVTLCEGVPMRNAVRRLEGYGLTEEKAVDLLRAAILRKDLDATNIDLESRQ